MDGTTKQKMSKETEDLNHTVNRLDLTDIHGTVQPTAAARIFFPSAHRTFSLINHVMPQMKSQKI